MQACAQASPARLSSGTQVAPSRRRSRRQPATVAAACSVSARPAASPRRPLPPPVAVALGSRCSPQRVPSQQQQQPWLPSRQHPRRRATLLPPAALPEALAALESGPARDLAAGLFAAAGSVALIKFFDTLEALGVIDRKLSRKLVHTLAGPGFLLCWPLFGAEPYSRFVAMCVPALNGLRLLLIGGGVVKDERAVMAVSRTGDPKELLRGPLYYVIVLMAVTAIYWRISPVGLIIASLMCGGDGLADIVGRRLGGGNPLPWNQEKSWAGSAAMFAGGLSMALGLISFFSYLGFLEAEMPAMAATVAVIALAATAVESLPVNQTVDDNLSVPGVAAFLGVLFLQVAVEVL